MIKEIKNYIISFFAYSVCAIEILYETIKEEIKNKINDL